MEPKVLTPSNSHNVLCLSNDSIFIALIVEEHHQIDILAGGSGGIYSYFAFNWLSCGSSHQDWKRVKVFCDSNNLLFIPSVGHWNSQITRNRLNDQYYETALHKVLNIRLAHCHIMKGTRGTDGEGGA